jgi:hypothetical protein
VGGLCISPGGSWCLSDDGAGDAGVGGVLIALIA